MVALASLLLSVALGDAPADASSVQLKPFFAPHASKGHLHWTLLDAPRRAAAEAKVRELYAEDTAFYAYHRLLRNRDGSAPGAVGCP